MGRSPCCSKEEGLNRGVWTAMEDKIFTDYIKGSFGSRKAPGKEKERKALSKSFPFQCLELSASQTTPNVHGGRKWRNLPKKAGLKRCGKSCRYRWLNYLRPDIKRGNITRDEEELIIRLHKLLGNRWSLIAGRLSGRTDNEIKNYWNTTYGKKVQGGQTMTNTTSNHNNPPNMAATGRPVEGVPEPPSGEPCVVVRTKATGWCINNTVLLPLNNEPQINNAAAEIETKPIDEINANQSEPLMLDHGFSSDFSTMMDDLEMDDEFLSNLVIDTDFMELCGFDDGEVHSDNMKTSTGDHGSYSSPNFDHQPFILSEDHNLDLQSMASNLLDYEIDW